MSACCGGCPFWRARADIRASPASGGGLDVGDLGAGICYGLPPDVVLVQVQTLAGAQALPQPLDRITLATRPACALYYGAPPTVALKD
jgi:hypothetical protein